MQTDVDRELDVWTSLSPKCPSELGQLLVISCPLPRGECAEPERVVRPTNTKAVQGIGDGIKPNSGPDVSHGAGVVM